MEKNEILRIKNLSVSYGVVKAVRDVNLKVNKGEIVALIGANGAGKTTLLEAILGIHPIESGNILYMEKDITRMHTEKIVASGICLIPEGRGVLPMMTVLENLELGAYHLTTNIEEHLERVFTWFPVLKDRIRQMGGTLSGGERQMLSIARGLMSNPKLMMLDEPSLGLSPVLVEELFNIIIELKKSGYTILLSEQNARKALQCAHRGYAFEKGNIVLYGSAHELASNPKVRQAYLGGVV